MMLNLERRRQFLTLMDESGWDTLLLYGNTARKDFFRSLVNFNFFGPHAVAALTRNGMSIVVSHRWDHELVKDAIDATVSWDPDFNSVIRRLISGKTAIAGREFMEAQQSVEAAMKRGLITWDKSEIPQAVFERRVDDMQRVLTERELSALVIYSDM